VVRKNLKNSNIRILEVDYDPENAYKQGHIPSAHLIWWVKDINDPIMQNIISRQYFEQLLFTIGATHETELVLYGDFDGWFAMFVFWMFQYYGYKKIRILRGGRKKWEAERREYTKDEPTKEKLSKFIQAPQNEWMQAYFQHVQRVIERSQETAVDDNTLPEEVDGEITAPQEYIMEHTQRGGHPQELRIFF
jgi:thiosulfate/3-mercaptopyruvate sulfurtransferase